MPKRCVFRDRLKESKVGSPPPKPGWKVVPQSRTGSRETPAAKFVVSSWHEQLPDVVGMRPQRATTSVREDDSRQQDTREQHQRTYACLDRHPEYWRVTGTIFFWHDAFPDTNEQNYSLDLTLYSLAITHRDPSTPPPQAVRDRRHRQTRHPFNGLFSRTTW